MAMQKTIWKDEYSVFNTEIDKQHKKLFDIINEIIDKGESNVHSEIITDTFLNLIKYSEYHFKEEEKYMIKFNYPEFSSHKHEHKEFIKKISLFSIRAMNNDEKVPMEIVNFLNSWIVDHVLNSDFKLRSLFQHEKV